MSASKSSAAEFSARIEGVRTLINVALSNSEDAIRLKGSASQRAAVSLINYHTALVLNGSNDTPSWIELSDPKGNASKTFRALFIDNVMQMPVKMDKKDPSKLELKVYNDKRDAVKTLLHEALPIACAMQRLGISVSALNAKTGLLTVPVAKFLPTGVMLSTETHGSKLTEVVLNGKTLSCYMEHDGSTKPVKLGLNGRTLVESASGIARTVKGRGVNANKTNGGDTAKPTIADALKGASTKDVFEALPKPVREQVLAHADIEQMVAAVRRQLCAPDAAPITKATFSAQMLKDLARIAEYYNGNVAPVMLAA